MTGTFTSPTERGKRQNAIQQAPQVVEEKSLSADQKVKVVVFPTRRKRKSGLQNIILCLTECPPEHFPDLERVLKIYLTGRKCLFLQRKMFLRPRAI